MGLLETDQHPPASAASLHKDMVKFSDAQNNATACIYQANWPACSFSSGSKWTWRAKSETASRNRRRLDMWDKKTSVTNTPNIGDNQAEPSNAESRQTNSQQDLPVVKNMQSYNNIRKKNS